MIQIMTIINKKMQELSNRTKPQPGQSIDKTYSNLIFTSNKKMLPNRSSTSSRSKRTQSIMMLRGNSNKSRTYRPSSSFNNDQVLEVNQDQKLNVINLLKGNNAMVPRLKSHYCKKITLSNLDKYYQQCVKTVRSGISTSLDFKHQQQIQKTPQKKSQQSSFFLNAQKKQHSRVSFTAEGSRYRLQRYELRKKDNSCENIEEKFIPKLLCQRDHDLQQLNENSNVFNFISAPQSHKKFSYSAFCRRPRKSKRYSNQQKREKDEFAINGWQTPQLALQQDMLAE